MADYMAAMSDNFVLSTSTNTAGNGPGLFDVTRERQKGSAAIPFEPPFLFALASAAKRRAG